jgi:hypothetical protein
MMSPSRLSNSFLIQEDMIRMCDKLPLFVESSNTELIDLLTKYIRLARLVTDKAGRGFIAQCGHWTAA